jgi:hypothetical protein
LDNHTATHKFLDYASAVHHRESRIATFSFLFDGRLSEPGQGDEVSMHGPFGTSAVLNVDYSSELICVIAPDRFLAVFAFGNHVSLFIAMSRE